MATLRKTTIDRRPEIDALRGAAVIGMIVFHVVVDLRLFLRSPASFTSGLPNWFWEHGADPIGILFFGVLGASAALRMRRLAPTEIRRAFFRRGGQLLALALLITIGTALFLPQAPIWFGVLHGLGVSLLLLPFFRTAGKWNLWAGLAIVAAGVVLDRMTFPFRGLLWLGFKPDSGFGGDWYPLIPWFGVALVGFYLSERHYERVSPTTAPMRRFPRALLWLGRHSLPIYLVHQPVLIGLLRLF